VSPCGNPCFWRLSGDLISVTSLCADFGAEDAVLTKAAPGFAEKEGILTSGGDRRSETFRLTTPCSVAKTWQVFRPSVVGYLLGYSTALNALVHRPST